MPTQFPSQPPGYLVAMGLGSIVIYDHKVLTFFLFRDGDLLFNPMPLPQILIADTTHFDNDQITYVPNLDPKP